MMQNGCRADTVLCYAVHAAIPNLGLSKDTKVICQGEGQPSSISIRLISSALAGRAGQAMSSAGITIRHSDMVVLAQRGTLGSERASKRGGRGYTRADWEAANERAGEDEQGERILPLCWLRPLDGKVRARARTAPHPLR